MSKDSTTIGSPTMLWQSSLFFLLFLVILNTDGSHATMIKVYQNVHPLVGNAAGQGGMKLVHDKPESLRDLTVCMRFSLKV